MIFFLTVYEWNDSCFDATTHVCEVRVFDQDESRLANVCNATRNRCRSLSRSNKGCWGKLAGRARACTHRTRLPRLTAITSVFPEHCETAGEGSHNNPTPLPLLCFFPFTRFFLPIFHIDILHQIVFMHFLLKFYFSLIWVTHKSLKLNIYFILLSKWKCGFSVSFFFFWNLNFFLLKK